MSTWSGIRNKLENEYLCPALRGRIQYFATSYWESHDQTGRAAIRLDGVEVLRLPCRPLLGGRLPLLRRTAATRRAMEELAARLEAASAAMKERRAKLRELERKLRREDD